MPTTRPSITPEKVRAGHVSAGAEVGPVEQALQIGLTGLQAQAGQMARPERNERNDGSVSRLLRCTAGAVTTHP